MKAEDIKPLKRQPTDGAFQMENINGEANFKTVKIAKGAKLFNDLDSVVTDFARVGRYECLRDEQQQAAWRIYLAHLYHQEACAALDRLFP